MVQPESDHSGQQGQKSQCIQAPCPQQICPFPEAAIIKQFVTFFLSEKK